MEKPDFLVNDVKQVQILQIFSDCNKNIKIKMHLNLFFFFFAKSHKKLMAWLY